MNFFDHKDLGNHLLQLCPKVVKHPVYVCVYAHTYTNTHTYPKCSLILLINFIIYKTIQLFFFINVSLMLALASLFTKNVHTKSALFYSSTKMGIQEFQAVNRQTPGTDANNITWSFNLYQMNWMPMSQ